MAMQQLRLWCPACRDYRQMSREGAPHGWCALVTLMTCLLFVPIWALIAFFAGFGVYRCQFCGEHYAKRADPYYAWRRERRRRPLRAIGAGLGWAAASAVAFARTLPGEAAAAYRTLPEWAVPIAWGLGGAVPFLIAAFAWRAFG